MKQVDISKYLDTFLSVQKRKEWWIPCPVRTLNEAMQIKEYMAISTKPWFKTLQIEFSGWSRQSVDFVTSNLGESHGFIFYFVCNRCNRRAKYLYEYDVNESPLCRRCCRLSYKPKLTKKMSRLSHFFKKPYFSTEDRIAIVKLAGITKEDLL